MDFSAKSGTRKWAKKEREIKRKIKEWQEEGVTIMKGYSKLPQLVSHNQMQFSAKPGTREWAEKWKKERKRDKEKDKRIRGGRINGNEGIISHSFGIDVLQSDTADVMLRISFKLSPLSVVYNKQSFNLALFSNMPKKDWHYNKDNLFYLNQNESPNSRNFWIIKSFSLRHNICRQKWWR